MTVVAPNSDLLAAGQFLDAAGCHGDRSTYRRVREVRWETLFTQTFKWTAGLADSDSVPSAHYWLVDAWKTWRTMQIVPKKLFFFTTE